MRVTAFNGVERRLAESDARLFRSDRLEGHGDQRLVAGLAEIVVPREGEDDPLRRDDVAIDSGHAVAMIALVDGEAVGAAFAELQFLAARGKILRTPPAHQMLWRRPDLER